MTIGRRPRTPPRSGRAETRDEAGGTIRAASVVLAVVAVTAMAIAGGSIAAGATDFGDRFADPTAAASALDCHGAGDGAIYEADSGFRVANTDSTPPADGETFLDDATVRFRTVSLSSVDASRVGLENATNETVCLSAVNATVAPVTVDRQAGRPVVLGGEIDAFALAADDDGDALMTIASDAPSEYTLTVEDTDLDEGEDLELLDAGDDVLAAATVDATGAASFSVPAGVRTLSMERAADGGGGFPLPPPPSDDPASFSLSDVSVEPTTVTVGETIVATATVTNDGDETGTNEVVFRVAGEAVAMESVTLLGGRSEGVSIEHQFDTADEYVISVGGEAPITVTVESANDSDGSADDGSTDGDAKTNSGDEDDAKTNADDEDDANTSASGGDEGGSSPILGAIVVIGVVAGTGVIVRYRFLGNQ